jgi:uncharacterized protein YbcV (DUF1398 family)
MNSQVADDCTRDSLEKSIPFPEVVQRLMDAGVESYFADLVAMRKTYYGTDGAVHVVEMPLADPVAVPVEFDAAGVRAALLAIQQRQISYPQFLTRIMGSGTWGYHVFLRGRRAVYLGRFGEFHVEHFPSE